MFLLCCEQYSFCSDWWLYSRITRTYQGSGDHKIETRSLKTAVRISIRSISITRNPFVRLRLAPCQPFEWISKNARKMDKQKKWAIEPHEIKAKQSRVNVGCGFSFFQKAVVCQLLFAHSITCLGFFEERSARCVYCSLYLIIKQNILSALLSEYKRDCSIRSFVVAVHRISFR